MAIRDLAANLHPGQVAGLFALMIAATLVETTPVPMGRASTGGVSLAALFIMSAGLLYGWAAATIVAFCASVVVQVLERKEAPRVCYNAAVYAVAGTLSALAMAVVGGIETLLLLLVSVAVGSLVFWAINITLIAAAVARVTRARMSFLARSTAVETLVPGAVMASTTVMLVSLVESSPYLPLTLVGPLAAITLYQRSVHRSLSAMKLARTDSLTELGNFRAFTEALEELERASEERELTVSLCLFDLDDFKAINDNHGHPAGDVALRHVGSALRQDGEAFRIGGDEFAILLEGKTEAEARTIAERVMHRVALSTFDHSDSVEVSAGIACYPQADMELADLVASADLALYVSKKAGKGQVSCFRPDMRPGSREPRPAGAGGIGATRAGDRRRRVRAA